MLKLSQIALLAALTGTLFGAGGSAHATTTSAAVRMCDANPNCTMSWGKENDSITMRVKGSGKVIDCPKKEGECVAVIKAPNLPLSSGSKNSGSPTGNQVATGGNGGGQPGGNSGAGGTGLQHLQANGGLGAPSFQ